MAEMAVTEQAQRSSGIAPGPRGIPFLGNAHQALRDPLGFFLTSRATYGDVVKFKMGPFDYFLVSDPDAVHHVLVDNVKAYTKSRNYLGLRVVLGDGLLTSEGDAWRKQRKLAQPAFHRDRMNGFVRQMAGSTRDMLNRWRSDDVRSTCMHREMMRLTFRIVGLTLFSSDVDGDAKEVGEALDVAMTWANDYAESLVRIPPYVPTPTNIRFKRAMKTLDGLIYRLIAERHGQEAAGKGTGDDLLGMLMDARSETGEGMNDKQLRDESMTMVLAGHETTANLLAWTFSLLSRHPEIARRVRDEARRVLGDREPELADMKALELTRRVLEEALRLYPPAWMFERQAVVPDRLGGFEVPKGAIVGVCTYVMHRHPDHWENPEGFDPDRFLPSRAEGRARYAYLPFGGGPRTCIGNHFALMESQVILAMVMRDWDVALDSSHRVELDPMVTLRPKHGIRVFLRPAPSPSSARLAPRTPSELRVDPS